MMPRRAQNVSLLLIMDNAHQTKHLILSSGKIYKSRRSRTEPDERAKLARQKSELCAHIQDLPLESLIRSGSAADGVEDSAVPWSSQVRGEKTVAHSPGIAVLRWSQFRTENRFALFLELLFFLGRNSGRKTASHFLELLSGQM
ncbi:hypothetical protein CK214_03660 [Mesorhizobium sp. WSM3882]|nr:hypothetical protein CK214_03660 [Mesorhizobium sp. WSM3882]